MKLQDILFHNVSAIPNTPINYTSENVIENMNQKYLFTETEFADNFRLLGQVDYVAKDQLQHDILTRLSRTFLGKVQAAFNNTK